jgi:hypothetical protein
MVMTAPAGTAPGPGHAAPTAAATTYDAVVVHSRQEPISNRFRYETRTWLVDLDRLPRLPRGLRWLSAFESRDHLGDARLSLRANVDRFLADHDIDVTDGRVLMLANPRALGHAVNPISVHWCYAADGVLAAVIAEVHNTYGDRHAYLLRPDASGAVDAVVDKAMYVSPFNPVEGRYHIIVSPPLDRVTVSVTLHRPDQAPLVATLQAHRRPVRPTPLMAVQSALTSFRVGALIRWQGIRLWRRGLRIEPRPVHPHQEGVS